MVNKTWSLGIMCESRWKCARFLGLSWQLWCVGCSFAGNECKGLYFPSFNKYNKSQLASHSSVCIKMFARRLLNPTKCVAKTASVTTQHRAKSSAATVPGFLYNNVWMKSTPLYIGYIFAGAVVVEFFFGFATDAVFGMVNRGVRYRICIIL